LIAANSLVEGRARLNFLKGSAGSWRVEEGRETEFLIFTSSVQPPARSELAITVSPIRILSTGPLAGVKCTATLENLLALEEARSRGFDEAVMLNERGEIAATTAANIFWVQGDEIFTPSPATGCVAGVTRRMVCEIAAKWKLHVVEGGFPVQRLLDAREVFLTSTAREVAFVSGFDIKEYSRKQARVTKLISRQFQNLIAGDKINP
jgi:branched-chain amino acid aminotransferase